MNNQQLIDEITHCIVEAMNPDQLILFGSRARGDAKDDADVDLLVVMDTDEPSPAYRSLSVRRALRGIPVGKDIIVYTPQEFRAWLGASASLVSRAVREGVELYRRTA